MTRTTLIVGSLLLAGLFGAPHAPGGAARPLGVVSAYPLTMGAG
jgi:hypothetical protein